MGRDIFLANPTNEQATSPYINAATHLYTVIRRSITVSEAEHGGLTSRFLASIDPTRTLWLGVIRCREAMALPPGNRCRLLQQAFLPAHAGCHPPELQWERSINSKSSRLNKLTLVTRGDFHFLCGWPKYWRQTDAHKPTGGFGSLISFLEKLTRRTRNYPSFTTDRKVG